MDLNKFQKIDLSQIKLSEKVISALKLYVWMRLYDTYDIKMPRQPIEDVYQEFLWCVDDLVEELK